MTMTAEQPADTTVPRAVGRVLDLLEIVLAEQRCNLTSAAGAAGLTPTTTLRHLRALEARGYVHRDESGTYSVGPTMLRLAASLRDVGPLQRMITATQPHLDALAETTGESTYLAVGDLASATYVASAESNRAIRHVGWIGQTVPLDGTAVGEAMQAVGACITRTGAVEPDITAISLALAVHQHPRVAVSVIGPSHRFGKRERSHHERALRDTVAAIGRQFGLADQEVTS